MLKMLFLFSIIITISLTILQVYGIQVIDLIIVMIIINFLSMGAYIELENKKIINESKAFIASKLENIENLSNKIITHVSSPNLALEEKLEKQKNDISYVLDKVSKKSLELEERLNLFAKVLSNNLTDKNEDEEEKKEEQKTQT
ncbi:MAG: hypothetical protein V1678_04625, partial [Candidatus Aenigmatarchaeota archaeon]